MDSVNEGTSHFVTAAFADENGDPVVPTAITVRIDDEVSGDAVREPAAVAPAAATVEIEITPAEKAVLDSRRAQEVRVVTVAAAYGAGSTKQVTAEYRYAVKNLRFHPNA